MDVREFNKKCSEFLEFEPAEFDNDCFEYKPLNFYGYISKMQFHEDWNWIMKICEKLESANITVSITNDYACIMSVENNIGLTLGSSGTKCNSKKEAILTAINQFLDWYKENTK